MYNFLRRYKNYKYKLHTELPNNHKITFFLRFHIVSSDLNFWMAR